MEEFKISKFDLEVLEHTSLSNPSFISKFDLEVLEGIVSTNINSPFISNYTLEILHKYNDNYTEPSIFNYFFSGTVKEYTTLVSRDIFAFSTDSGILVGKSASELNGTFFLPVTTSGSCFLVCFSGNPNFNHIIAANVLPAA